MQQKAFIHILTTQKSHRQKPMALQTDTDDEEKQNCRNCAAVHKQGFEPQHFNNSRKSVHLSTKYTILWCI